MRFEKTTCPSSYLYGPAQEGWTKKEIIRPAFKKPRHYGVDLDFLASMRTIQTAVSLLQVMQS